MAEETIAKMKTVYWMGKNICKSYDWLGVGHGVIYLSILSLSFHLLMGQWNIIQP